MKSIRMKSMLLAAVACALSFCLPMIVAAQDDRKPESPRSESPRSESPRSESPRSDPAPAPRNDPPASPPSSGGSSNNDNNSSRNNDSGSRNTDNDNGRRNRGDNGDPRRNDNSSSRRANTNPPSGNRGNTRVSGTTEGDGRSNRRDRIIETQGEVITPGRISIGGTPGENPGIRPGVNPNNGNRAGGNPTGSGNPGGTHPRGGPTGGGRDRDRCPDRDRHGDHHGGHHRHTEVCYRAPTYDDTITYVQSNYPDYDDSQSAYEIGFHDGVFTGANDGRRQQTYDPERSHFYREAKRGYRSAKGSRDVYEQAYRDGFLHGYREGYEHWQDHFIGGVFRP